MGGSASVASLSPASLIQPAEGHTASKTESTSGPNPPHFSRFILRLHITAAHVEKRTREDRGTCTEPSLHGCKVEAALGGPLCREAAASAAVAASERVRPCAREGCMGSR